MIGVVVFYMPLPLPLPLPLLLLTSNTIREINPESTPTMRGHGYWLHRYRPTDCALRKRDFGDGELQCRCSASISMEHGAWSTEH